MATHGEKIDELMKLVATLNEPLNNHREEVKGLRPDITENGKSLSELATVIRHIEQQTAELRAWKDNIGLDGMQREIALLQEKVGTLSSASNTSGNRWWTFWTAVAAAIIGASISGIITYFATRT